MMHRWLAPSILAVCAIADGLGGSGCTDSQTKLSAMGVASEVDIARALLVERSSRPNGAMASERLRERASRLLFLAEMEGWMDAALEKGSSIEPIDEFPDEFLFSVEPERADDDDGDAPVFDPALCDEAMLLADPPGAGGPS